MSKETSQTDPGEVRRGEVPYVLAGVDKSVDKSVDEMWISPESLYKSTGPVTSNLSNEVSVVRS